MLKDLNPNYYTADVKSINNRLQGYAQTHCVSRNGTKDGRQPDNGLQC